MKIKGILTAAVMVMMAMSLAMADEPKNEAPKARIDIEGSGEKVSMVFNDGTEGVVGCEAPWVKENKDQRLVIEFPASAEWRKTSFMFTPKSSGKVTLEIMGNWSADPKEYEWFWYDNFTAEGATITNGDFEIKDANGKPEGWTITNAAKVGSTAQSGTVAVKTRQHDRVTQEIQVKAGTPVKVTFWVKSDK